MLDATIFLQESIMNASPRVSFMETKAIRKNDMRRLSLEDSLQSLM